ncbi:hypothetical protein C5167_023008 [Papaver somniferum]|uniref:Uncharacterized protein n=1 Tax=Papaver somniferum TaxID=3469 RepID=A0A4Y7JND9_PAPSO|nr:hypothetical protein C5167_023008 [Papaver somniferum]
MEVPSFSWLAEHSKVLIFKWKVQEKDDENAYRLRFARWKIRDICKSLEINVSQFGKVKFILAELQDI